MPARKTHKSCRRALPRERRKTRPRSWSALTLAQVPANRPPKQFDPYLGDYEHLMAVGKDFYGIFSANNTPKKNKFSE